jgi:hypothetical protein
MKKFNNLIILAPLAYAIHHYEEHIVFNFREWRLKYFLDNNHIPTEAVLCILISVLLLAVFFQLISRSRATAHILLFFLMATQVVNAAFHIFFSLYYSDFSPGTITAILLYLPINFLIIQSAFREGLLKNSTELIIIFILGISTFTLFELVGPKVWLVSFSMCFIYYFWMSKISSSKI